MPIIPCLIAYCRAGFEPECAQELNAAAGLLGVEGEIDAPSNRGFVVFQPRLADQATELSELNFERLVFARQMLWPALRVNDLPRDDRVAPLLDAARALARHYSAILVETADTNEAKELSALCRQLSVPLAAAAEQQALLTLDAERADNAQSFSARNADMRATRSARTAAPRLHVLLLDSTSAYVGLSKPGNSSAWPQGIPRLKMPYGAPSRSTLKLAEAIATLLTPEEEQRLLQPGMRAVDLGAAPGGWTWHLINRGFHVTAIDNGPLTADLVDNALVRHMRVDAFHYLPHKPVDWLTCDVAAQPSRVAVLVAQWIAGGHARHALFNLKLPMKKRYAELRRCESLMGEQLEAAGIRYALRFKQLYHDREEVTGFCTVATAPSRRRRNAAPPRQAPPAQRRSARPPARR